MGYNVTSWELGDRDLSLDEFPVFEDRKWVGEGMKMTMTETDEVLLIGMDGDDPVWAGKLRLTDMRVKVDPDGRMHLSFKADPLEDSPFAFEKLPE